MTAAGFRLGMVQTGGTIGCTWADDGVAVLSGRATVAATDLRRLWKGPHEPTVLSRAPINRASEDLQPDDWLAVTGAVRQLAIEGAHAVVVLHGTDTAAYTCAALSFLLNRIDIPVVVTGSSLPPDHPGSDADANLEVALTAARHAPPGVHLAFCAPGTGVGELHLGTRVRKIGDPAHPFVTVGGPPIARITAYGYEQLAEAPRPFHTPTVTAVDPAVLSLRCHPGVDFEAMRSVIAGSGLHGVVLELYASGTAPTRPGRSSLPDFAAWCRKEGVPVVSTLWTANGSIPPRYESTLALDDAEILFLPALLPEVATVKLMWSLAQPRTDPLTLMTTPVRGELTPLTLSRD